MTKVSNQKPQDYSDLAFEIFDAMSAQMPDALIDAASTGQLWHAALA